MSASGRHLWTFGSERDPRVWMVARGATLGLLDPADGAVREVGRLACGTIYDAVWR